MDWNGTQGPPASLPCQQQRKFPTNTACTVIVQWVDSSTSLWVVMHAELDTVDLVQVGMQEHHASNHDTLDSFAVGDVVSAVFPEDDLWYRAKVLNMDPIVVQFIDYGNVETVYKVAPLPPKLARLHPLAIKIQLADKLDPCPDIDDELLVNYITSENGVAVVRATSASADFDADAVASCESVIKQQDEVSHVPHQFGAGKISEGVFSEDKNILAQGEVELSKLISSQPVEVSIELASPAPRDAASEMSAGALKPEEVGISISVELPCGHAALNGSTINVAEANSVTKPPEAASIIGPVQNEPIAVVPEDLCATIPLEGTVLNLPQQSVPAPVFQFGNNEQVSTPARELVINTLPDVAESQSTTAIFGSTDRLPGTYSGVSSENSGVLSNRIESDASVDSTSDAFSNETIRSVPQTDSISKAGELVSPILGVVPIEMVLVQEVALTEVDATAPEKVSTPEVLVVPATSQEVAAPEVPLLPASPQVEVLPEVLAVSAAPLEIPQEVVPAAPQEVAPPEVVVDPAAQPEVVVDPAAQPEVVVDPAAQPEVVVDPAAQPEVVVDPGAQPEVVVDPAAQPEVVVDPAAQPEVVVDPAAQPEVVVDPAAQPEVVVDHAALPEVVVDPAALPEVVVDPAAQPEVLVDPAALQEEVLPEILVDPAATQEVLHDVPAAPQVVTPPEVLVVPAALQEEVLPEVVVSPAALAEEVLPAVLVGPAALQEAPPEVFVLPAAPQEVPTELVLSASQKVMTEMVLTAPQEVKTEVVLTAPQEVTTELGRSTPRVHSDVVPAAPLDQCDVTPQEVASQEVTPKSAMVSATPDVVAPTAPENSSKSCNLEIRPPVPCLDTNEQTSDIISVIPKKLLKKASHGSSTDTISDLRSDRSVLKASKNVKPRTVSDMPKHDTIQTADSSMAASQSDSSLNATAKIFTMSSTAPVPPLIPKRRPSQSLYYEVLQKKLDPSNDSSPLPQMCDNSQFIRNVEFELTLIREQSRIQMLQFQTKMEQQLAYQMNSLKQEVDRQLSSIGHKLATIMADIALLKNDFEMARYSQPSGMPPVSSINYQNSKSLSNMPPVNRESTHGRPAQFLNNGSKEMCSNQFVDCPGPSTTTSAKNAASKCLFVRNIPEKISADHLFNLFSVYGIVNKVKIIGHQRANIEMGDKAQAAIAIRYLHNVPLMGSRINVSSDRCQSLMLYPEDLESNVGKDFTTKHTVRMQRFKPDQWTAQECVAPGKRLFVSNIHKSLSDEKIEEAFIKEGFKSKIAIKMTSDEARKIAFINCDTTEEAINILTVMHLKELADWMRIRIDFCKKYPSQK